MSGPGVTSPQSVYEHPWVVRFCHWTNAVAIIVLTLSGLQIFDAFPSFGAKIPESDLIEAVPAAVTLGGDDADAAVAGEVRDRLVHAVADRHRERLAARSWARTAACRAPR